jgi:hypothetical protein
MVIVNYISIIFRVINVVDIFIAINVVMVILRIIKCIARLLVGSSNLVKREIFYSFVDFKV